MKDSGTALSRRAKRRVYGPPHTAYVDAAGGAKDVARAEVEEILADPIVPSSRRTGVDNPRGLIVLRDGDYRRLLELCLRLTTASDLRMIIHQEPVERVQELQASLSRAPFDLFVPEGSAVGLSVDSTASTVFHEGLVREACLRTLATSKIHAADADEPVGQRITVSLLHDTLRISISLAGEPLWKRGYRVASGAVAPLREDLAAVAVRRSYPRDSERPPILLLPFAGSGTFAFETAFHAQGLSSAFFGRSFAFQSFPFGAPKSVDYALEQIAGRLRSRFEAPIRATLLDTDAEVLGQARRNLDSFASGLAAWNLPSVLDCDVRREDALAGPWSNLVAKGDTVYLPLNPPYGRRLANENVEGLYAEIGRRIADLSSVCRLFGCCLCPSVDTWRIVRSASSDAGLSVETLHVGQGGLDIRLLSFAPQ